MPRVALTFHIGYDIAPYVEALEAAGVTPVLRTPDQGNDSLEGLSGLVLAGGVDLDPALYGQEPAPETQSPRRDRDAMESAYLRAALAADLPLLAICRGMQLFNVIHGGTLAQHIEGHRATPANKSLPAHPVAVQAGTRLAAILGAGEQAVNSRHHQAVNRVGDGLVVSARAGDGVIEGLERTDRKFALGVQWHPENMIYRFAAQRRLFEAFRQAL